jgi:hypothetical protein
MEIIITTAKNVLTNELIVSLLKDVTKSTVCSIEYIVDESQSRTVKGQKQLQKRVKISNLYLNHDYTKKVQNLSGDTTFQSFELKGKTRISSTLIESDNTKEILLDGKILATESVKLLGYFHNGEPITQANAIAENLFAPAFFDTTKKTTSGRGLLTEEEDFKMITLGIKNIIYLKCFGKEYYR